MAVGPFLLHQAPPFPQVLHAHQLLPQKVPLPEKTWQDLHASFALAAAVQQKPGSAFLFAAVMDIW